MYATQDIDYTDFPLSEMKLYCCFMANIGSSCLLVNTKVTLLPYWRHASFAVPSALIASLEAVSSAESLALPCQQVL